MSATVIAIGLSPADFEALPVFDTPDDAWADGIRDPDGFRLEGWSYERHIERMRRAAVAARVEAHPPRPDPVAAEDRRREAFAAQQRAGQPGSVERVADVVTITDEACGVRFTLTVDLSGTDAAMTWAEIETFKGRIFGRLRVLAGAAQRAASLGVIDGRGFERGEE